MSKLIIMLTCASLALLIILSIVNPSNSLLWLASTTGWFTLLRIGMLAILSSLLITEPPRSIWLRIIFGIASIGLLAFVVHQTDIYQMKILDSLSLLEVSIAAGLAALEYDPAPVTDKEDEKPATFAPAEAWQHTA